MSSEGGDAGATCGEARRGGPAADQRHTWEESDPLGSQGRPPADSEEEPQPGEEDEEDDGEKGDNGGNTSSEEGAVGGRADKAQGMNSTCSSETCIPTPSCRICFQGAEQVFLLGLLSASVCTSHPSPARPQPKVKVSMLSPDWLTAAARLIRGDVKLLSGCLLLIGCLLVSADEASSVWVDHGRSSSCNGFPILCLND